MLPTRDTMVPSLRGVIIPIGIGGTLDAISLQTGIFDGSATYYWLLTQKQLDEPKLDPKLPSPAEGLLAMASCTALDLVQDIPFVPF